jgi:hypothetical protein
MGRVRRNSSKAARSSVSDAFKGPDPVYVFPYEALHLLSSHLCLEDLANASQVCRAWAQHIREGQPMNCKRTMDLGTAK